ncbi:MAG: 3-methyl-2-oxobutanoate hydroxymethyltransferase, partial [Candidatus Thermoplasmatota archaeon]|nr:3-methyl-2-oxobutanoate hydroxymethyltransferase [Candidatus Thermoplasmatota archaeon]
KGMELGEIKLLKNVRKVTVLTAYDVQTAKILDTAGIDMILVGDSLGMVVLGYEDTKQVTMEDMIRHTEAVARGAPSTHIIGDLPINSYNTVEDALRNARRLLDAGANSVKLEGNKPEVVRALVAEGIPVMGHLGLLPQTAEVMKVRGKKRSEAERILADAKELEAIQQGLKAGKTFEMDFRTDPGMMSQEGLISIGVIDRAKAVEL